MKLFNIFKRKPKQTSFCYCPKCKNELISSNSFVREDDCCAYYKCSKCGKETMWRLDTPVPFLLCEKTKNGWKTTATIKLK